MKKICLHLLFSFITLQSFEQDVTTKLSREIAALEADSQLHGAVISLYVINAATGDIVFEKNATTGMAPASTQKIITACTAYELLGKDFHYNTGVLYSGNIRNGLLNGNIYINGSGDPTLGSWRWKQTSEASVLERLSDAIQKKGIKQFNSLVINNEGWEGEIIPDGWIWEDLGNYYGAPALGLNWRENQYDLLLTSGSNVGDSVQITGTLPLLYNAHFISYVTAAPKGTGDNTNIYLPFNSSPANVRGTIPVNESRFVISGAMPDVKQQFVSTVANHLKSKGIKNNISLIGSAKEGRKDMFPLYTESSPPLDSMVFWFLKKSINLYGEALVKTLAYNNKLPATTENGISLVKEVWGRHGISPTELRMADGSGLSPTNRVTTHAQVTILKYASLQPWFQGFYNALPEYNGMKMKSGTIGGVKGFCGYQTSKDGHQYIFSFLVNNYNGTEKAVVQKMYKVLNELK